jgi:hypothetical protein
MRGDIYTAPADQRHQSLQADQWLVPLHHAVEALHRHEGVVLAQTQVMLRQQPADLMTMRPNINTVT